MHCQAPTKSNPHVDEMAGKGASGFMMAEHVVLNDSRLVRQS